MENTKQRMQIIGKPTINPFLFYSGKIAGYLSWGLFFVHFFVNLNQIDNPISLRYISYLIFCIGLVISIISILNLGSSTTLGIPEKKTEFKNKGLYKFSRNPMYLGFNLLTIASILHTMNFIVLGLAIYSIVIYHLIVLGEEEFLKSRFDNDYRQYCKSVRRYI